MNSNFWSKLPRPFFVLAPMADVTDAAFRRVIATRGKPDVMYTEFVSADGLVRAPEAGKQKLLRDFMYTESERPIVAQIFSGKPDMVRQAAHLIVKLGFDGLDINMGCPDQSIEKQGGGAALIKNPALARELIRAAKQGITEAGSTIPVSVKTRLGYSTNEIETWLSELLAENPATIIIHARTRKEMSKVPAHWDMVKRAVEIRNEKKSDTLIVGNGDVTDLVDAKKKVEETGADGIMLGRAIFGNPWLFANLAHVGRGSQIERPAKLRALRGAKEDSPSIFERLNTLIEHTEQYEKLLGDIKSFAIMKKHFKAYVTDFDGASELRAKLMETNTAGEVKTIIEDFLQKLPKN